MRLDVAAMAAAVKAAMAVAAAGAAVAGGAVSSRTVPFGVGLGSTEEAVQERLPLTQVEHNADLDLSFKPKEQAFFSNCQAQLLSHDSLA